MSLILSETQRRQEWLILLLDAYEIIDTGIKEAINTHEKRHNTKLACSKGCFHCCKTHRDIPLYLHELTGIYWYVLEGMNPSEREILKLQLLAHKKGEPCPFLMGGMCCIHPMRPAACRAFNVFGKACSSGEDPYYTRRQDVLIPPRGYIQKAFLKILSFYGLKNNKIGIDLVEEFIHSQALVLQDIDWKALARRIDDRTDL